MNSFDIQSGHFQNDIIVGGIRFSVDAPVISMESHGLLFKVGPCARRRAPKQLIDLIVLHWTAGEATARQTYRTLSGRELGVEFVVDRQGIIWQFADPALIDTFDAGSANRRSAGIEITNYGFRRSGKKIPMKGRDRPKYRTTLNGRSREFAGYYPAQIQSAIALCDTLRSPLRYVSKVIPRDGNGHLLKRTMTKKELQEFSGVLGHFHISKAKSDPGTDIFEAFDLAGYG